MVAWSSLVSIGRLHPPRLQYRPKAIGESRSPRNWSGKGVWSITFNSEGSEGFGSPPAVTLETTTSCRVPHCRFKGRGSVSISAPPSSRMTTAPFVMVRGRRGREARPPSARSSVWPEVTTGTTPIADFGVGVSVVGERAILAVRGEVDMLTTPDLIAMVDAAIDDGHRSVVLDLAELDFMSVMGLRAIAGGADRLEVAGGALTIRSPSALVRRLLDIMGLAGLVHLEEPGRLDGLAQSSRVPPQCRPYSHLRRVTAVPSDDEVVNSALRLVVALARAAVGARRRQRVASAPWVPRHSGSERPDHRGDGCHFSTPPGRDLRRRFG